MAKIIVAIDTPSIDEMKAIHDELGDLPIIYKIGLEFFQARGPAGIEAFQSIGIDDQQIFFDQKFADISNTVGGAARSALSHFKPLIMNVFGLAGRQSMQAFAQTVHDMSPATKAIAVTALTSWTEDECQEMTGYGLQETTLRLARVAHKSSCDGIVCHPAFAAILREYHGKSFAIITPGIRFPEDNPDDQSNPAHPRSAALAGSDFLVIGRPILRPNNGSRYDAAQRFIEAAML